uniref:Uncharacterized protein n=1 Tax=Rousettus aegyptiacus TaxID=9407 RepID=A0A7J8CIJ9_ROUAE|nr:hypothetical protein HJG63_009166 [Rousettus aegyptiacus]
MLGPLTSKESRAGTEPPSPARRHAIGLPFCVLGYGPDLGDACVPPPPSSGPGRATGRAGRGGRPDICLCFAALPPPAPPSSAPFRPRPAPSSRARTRRRHRLRLPRARGRKVSGPGSRLPARTRLRPGSLRGRARRPPSRTSGELRMRSAERLLFPPNHQKDDALVPSVGPVPPPPARHPPTPNETARTISTYWLAVRCDSVRRSWRHSTACCTQ